VQLREASSGPLAPRHRLLGSAARAASTKAPDAALLDVNLQGVTVLPVAQECQRRKIPFILITGYGAYRLTSRCSTTLSACASIQ
jgi:hypothetical protein